MIDTQSLYPFRNNLREYDADKGLLLELNNFTYNFLWKVSIARDNFGEKIWTRLLMRPLQEKESAPTDFVFDVLKEIVTVHHPSASCIVLM